MKDNSHAPSGQGIGCPGSRKCDRNSHDVALLVSAFITAAALSAPAAAVMISGISPISGPAGTTVIISGTNFSAIAVSNIVYFGAVRAKVAAASKGHLNVVAPEGATYAPPTVTVNGLTAWANTPFLETFSSSGPLDASSLAAPLQLGSGNGPCRVAIGDLDGDGRPDLVVANCYDGTVYVYRNIGTGAGLSSNSFAPPVVLPVSGGGQNLFGVALSDVDGDGRLDILLASRASNCVAVIRNLCSPGVITTNSFAPHVDFPVGLTPTAIAVMDLDGDGRPDVVTANIGSNTVSVLHNIETGPGITSNSFAAFIDFTVGPAPSGVAIADLDGDGKPDIVAVNKNDPSRVVSLLRNVTVRGVISSNSFAPQVCLAGANDGETVAIADLDGDGKPDLIVGSWNADVISVYRNTSSAGTLDTNSFGPRVDFPAGGSVNSTIGVGDLSGNGKPDVAIVAQLPNQLSIFRNTGAPGDFTTNSFAPRVDFPTGWNPQGLAIGDLDGDGRPDLVFGNDYDGNIWLYRNMVQASTPPPPGMVSWWRAEGDASDQEGRNNGALVGGVTFAPGEVGRAFSFNGSNSYVEVADSPSIRLTSSLTIEFWVQRQQTNWITDYLINKGGDWTGGMLNYGVCVAPPPWGDYTLQFLFAGGNRHTAASLADTNWHHCAVVAQNGAVNPTMYLDGVQYPITSSEGVGKIVLYPSTQPLHIGAQIDPTWNYYSKSLIDELSIYDRALTSSEIMAIYKAGNSGKRLPAPEPPFIVTQPRNQKLLAGLEADFSVKVKGTPPLSYQWYYDGQPLDGETESNLTFRTTSTSQSGQYWVLVTNVAGQVQSGPANLTVVIETTPPWVGITSPANGVTRTNVVIKVSGTATDNVQVAEVVFQNNGQAFENAVTTNGWTNWTASFAAAPGTNFFRVRAIDTSSNLSQFATRSIFHPVPSPLTLLTNGVGAVKPNWGGSNLDIGRAYTLTAVAGKGEVFAGWGMGGGRGLVSTNPVLIFRMKSNMVLQASFITNPFPPVSGTYNGLFYQADGIAEKTSGFVTFTLNGSGLYTGTLKGDGGSYPFMGELWVDGTSATRVIRTNKAALTLVMQVGLTNGTDEAAGTVRDGNWVGELFADRLVFDAKKRPAPQAGYYTLALLNTNEDMMAPEGDGVATVAVSKGGIVQLYGNLPDGTVISQQTGLSKNGQWPLFVNLYNGNGSLLGWGALTNAPDLSIQGDISWIKDPIGGVAYPDGFVTDVELLGSSYSRPPRGARVLEITNGEVVLCGDSLSQPLTNEVFLSSNNLITVTAGKNHLSIALNVLSGHCGGGFVAPGTNGAGLISGVILPQDNSVRGYFANRTHSGWFILRPAPQE